ncbi:MAG: hypothetical protein WD995_06970 [Gemmatimonadota bacterium]
MGAARALESGLANVRLARVPGSGTPPPSSPENAAHDVPYILKLIQDATAEVESVGTTLLEHRPAAVRSF